MCDDDDNAPRQRLPWTRLAGSAATDEELEELKDEIAELKKMLATAVAICEDAGISEREIELVTDHADPVTAILRLKGYDG